MMSAQSDRFERIEMRLARIKSILTSTKGRARLDNDGIGRCDGLVDMISEELQLVKKDALSPFPIVCSCGATYDEAEWGTLDRAGTMPDGDGGHLELRQCVACNSTRAVPVTNGVES